MFAQCLKRFSDDNMKKIGLCRYKYINYFSVDYDILRDCNGTRTHNHLVRKQRVNHLAKLTK